MAEVRSQIIISAKDAATKVLGGISKSLKDLSKHGEQVGKDFKTLGKLTIAGVGGLVALATKAGMSAARVEELGFALNAIAKANNISKDAVDGTVNSLREMNIANEKALQITSLFIQSELDLADATKIATAAKDLAVVAGLDSSEATETLTSAIITQRPMLLRQFGIVSGLDQIYERYAETTGKAAKDLTELEKKQAFLNTILEAGEKVAGTYDAAMGSVSKRFRSLTGRIIPDFMAKIGQAFAPILVVVIDGITNAIKNLSIWVDQNQERIKVWGEQLREAFTKIVDGFKAFVEFILNNKEIIIGILAALAVGVGALVASFLIVHGVSILVFTAIIAIVTLLAKAWNTNFLGIQDIVQGFVTFFKASFEFIKLVVQGVTDFFQNIIFPIIVEFFDGIKKWILLFVAIWQLQFAIIKAVLEIVINWFWDWAGPTIMRFFDFIVKIVKAYIENWKLGWNMVKTIIKAVVDWFMSNIHPTIKSFFENISKALSILREAFDKKWEEIKEIVRGAIDFIKDIIDKFTPKIKIGLDLPDVASAWENVKQRARDVGIPGFQTGGIVPGPVGAPVPILAHGGERVTPTGLMGGERASDGGGATFQVFIGLYAGSETEKRNIAQDLYGALVQVAEAQNKSVQELMGR